MPSRPRRRTADPPVRGRTDMKVEDELLEAVGAEAMQPVTTSCTSALPRQSDLADDCLVLVLDLLRLGVDRLGRGLGPAPLRALTPELSV